MSPSRLGRKRSNEFQNGGSDCAAGEVVGRRENVWSGLELRRGKALLGHLPTLSLTQRLPAPSTQPTIVLSLHQASSLAAIDCISLKSCKILERDAYK
jgi:hypothetical protein